MSYAKDLPGQRLGQRPGHVRFGAGRRARPRVPVGGPGHASPSAEVPAATDQALTCVGASRWSRRQSRDQRQLINTAKNSEKFARALGAGGVVLPPTLSSLA